MKILKAIMVAFVLLSSATNIQAQTTINFNFTGSSDTWIVPAGVTSITIEVWGAQGANGSVGTSPGIGANGGMSSGTLPVIPGEVLSIFVGGQNGFNGGGPAGAHTGSGAQTFAGNGGGASDVRQGGSGFANRVIVGGGGGGGAASNAGNCDDGNASNGGSAGGMIGAAGDHGSGCACIPCSGAGGGGATQAVGGIGGAAGSNCSGTGVPGTNGDAGLAGMGGCGANNGCTAVFQGGPGGGGGGGYFGGGGGGAGAGGSGGNFSGGGGGGGSSYFGVLTGGSSLAGVRTGDGLVSITFNVLAIPTMSQWGLILFGLLLLNLVIVGMRKRKLALN